MEALNLLGAGGCRRVVLVYELLVEPSTPTSSGQVGEPSQSCCKRFIFKLGAAWDNHVAAGFVIWDLWICFFQIVAHVVVCF